jgi:hypothetical protein
MINKIYSILMRGIAAEGPYARHVDPAARKITYDNSIATILVPQSDKGYMAYCANQLAEICTRSPLKSEMLSADSMNTYQFEIQPIDMQTNINSPIGYTVQLLEPSLAKEWITRSYPVVVDNTALTISIPTLSISVPYTWSGNLSSVVDTKEGVKLRIAGPTPSTVLNFSISLVRRPCRDIAGLPEILRNSGISQSPEYVDYINDPDINVSLPACVLNYCNGVSE